MANKTIADLTELTSLADDDLLIAYDISAGRIFVTGKRWTKLFEIKITE